jgi:hypothetical protein
MGLNDGQGYDMSRCRLIDAFLLACVVEVKRHISKAPNMSKNLGSSAFSHSFSHEFTVRRHQAQFPLL